MNSININQLREKQATEDLKKISESIFTIEIQPNDVTTTVQVNKTLHISPSTKRNCSFTSSSSQKSRRISLFEPKR